MASSISLNYKLEQSKQLIATLVEKYRRVISENRASFYNEEMTKKDFILPLFRALKWDVENSSEVTAEEKISKKRVDYGFRINGIPKFMLEAKKLKADLLRTEFVKQAIDYSWNKGCTWAVLTNFETLAIFNAEWKSENTWHNRFRTITCDEFIERFDELWLLSKESFETNLINKEAEKVGKKVKKTSVDRQLLYDFTRFRELLSKNITKLNQDKNINEDELDESVQRILDRLIFIRNCEDRELEPKILISNYREWGTRGKGQLIKSLRETFKTFDRLYNSKIFAEHLCDKLDVDNDVLREIIEGLYYTKDESVSYDFSAIDANVLGTIYEQYLSHILKKTEKRAILTDNHSHRKEQGIYYTPTYVVDYIVKNTVGIYLENNTKERIEQIKILDPACGSGSFLIKAFDVLNEYQSKSDATYHQSELDFKIDTIFTKKAKILQTNIFGVDLDRQAVEIAQLNLLLKIAEKKKRLPLLGENIKCGNSLIDDKEIVGEKAFKWEYEFEDIMKNGGFDVIIGNPPYISNWQLSKVDRNMVTFLDKKYSSVTVGHWDIYILFIKRALELLKNNGFLSFIVPSSFAKEKYGKKLREYIIKNCTILSLAEFGTETVFKNVARQYIIFVIQKKRPTNKLTEITYFKNNGFEKSHSISQKIFLNLHNFTFRTDLDDKQITILEKIASTKCFIGNICCVNVGVVAHSRKGAPVSFKKNDVIYNEYKPNYKKYIEGRDISRYSYSWKGLYMDYENNAKNFHRPKYPELFDNNKIIIRRVSGKNNSIIAVYDDTNLYTNDNLINVIPWDDDIMKLQSPEKKWGIFKPYKYFSLKYILGILNSKLITFYFNKTLATGTLQGTYSGVYPEDMRMIPIKKLSEIQQQPVIELVDKMLSLNKRLNDLEDKITDERIKIENEIKMNDYKIDELIYSIYNISNDEKKLLNIISNKETS